MKPRLEALLKAFDAFMDAPQGPEAARLQLIYETTLDEVAAELHLPVQTLDQLVRRKHKPWLNANKKFSSMPPKA